MLAKKSIFNLGCNNRFYFNIEDGKTDFSFSIDKEKNIKSLTFGNLISNSNQIRYLYSEGSHTLGFNMFKDTNAEFKFNSQTKDLESFHIKGPDSFDLNFHDKTFKYQTKVSLEQYSVAVPILYKNKELLFENGTTSLNIDSNLQCSNIKSFIEFRLSDAIKPNYYAYCAINNFSELNYQLSLGKKFKHGNSEVVLSGVGLKPSLTGICILKEGNSKLGVLLSREEHKIGARASFGPFKLKVLETNWKEVVGSITFKKCGYKVVAGVSHKDGEYGFVGMLSLKASEV